MKQSPLIGLLGAALLGGCPGDATPDPEPTPFEPVEWSRVAPRISHQRRWLTELRAIVHLHSPWSHDACDGNGLPDGNPNEECLAQLKEGVCAAGIDVAFTSDHPSYAETTTVEGMLWIGPDDEAIPGPQGGPEGVWWACDDGTRVLVLPGLESAQMMPLGIQRHVDGGYGQDSPEGMDAVRDAGGVTWLAHTEERDPEHIASLGVEGFEGYQLHANLDPGIREDILGLEPFSWLQDVGPFFFPDNFDLDQEPEPDLASLVFVLPNDPAMRALEIVGQDQRVGTTGGTDAHQNVISGELADGERGDSYRRTMRWMHTRIRVSGELTPASAREALREARAFVVFGAFGEPAGFDWKAELDGTVYEPGQEVPVGAALTVNPPTLAARSPRGATEPAIRTVVFHSDGANRRVLAESTGEAISLTLEDAGVVRVESWITPHHLTPYLGDVAEELSSREVLWIQTGGMFVRSAR
jgi:hypothetical protein